MMQRLAILVLFFAIAPAYADDRKEHAKRAVNAGLAAQAAGRYDEAIADYKEAYDIVPHPELLFDLGQAYRLKDAAEIAVEYYDRYLAVEPDGRVAKDARRWIAELAPVVQARKAERLHRMNVQTDAQIEEALSAEHQRALAKTRAQDVARHAQAMRDAELDDSRYEQHGTSHRGTYAAVLATLGGGAAVTGLVFGQLARSKQAEARDICPGGVCANAGDAARANSLLAQSRSRGNVSTGFMIGGASALVLSGIVWWTRGENGHATRTAIAPLVTDSQVGMVLGGAF
jgi:tetratricopeptide (TPR) repeat protein